MSFDIRNMLSTRRLRLTKIVRELRISQARQGPLQRLVAA